LACLQVKGVGSSKSRGKHGVLILSHRTALWRKTTSGQQENVMRDGRGVLRNRGTPLREERVHNNRLHRRSWTMDVSHAQIH